MCSLIVRVSGLSRQQVSTIVNRAKKGADRNPHSGLLSPSVANLLSQKKARKLLEEHGWTCTIGTKHNVKMEKAGERPITLPMKSGQDYGKGLSAAIRRQAGL